MKKYINKLKMLLPKNKDINLLERNETKHPLLQIFFRNKNNGK